MSLLLKRKDFIQKKFYNNPAEEVAPQLIGCRIRTLSTSGEKIYSTIVETEAYAPGDPACHAYTKRTPRNGAMFGDSGTIYVYKIYGIHLCLNIVTQKKDIPAAVLIRAVEIDPENLKKLGFEFDHRVGAGPGKLCKILQITQKFNGMSIFENREFAVLKRTKEMEAQIKEKNSIVQTRRIGISRGMEFPWRWYLYRSRSVSIRDKKAENLL